MLHAPTAVAMPTFLQCDVQTVLQAAQLASCLLLRASATVDSTSKARLKTGTGNRPDLFTLLFIPILYIEGLFMIFLMTLLVAQVT